MLDLATRPGCDTQPPHIASATLTYILDGRAAQADVETRRQHKSFGHSTDGLLDRSTGAGLIKWRLRNVLAFVEAHLEERITLECLARAAGLSRMHFAAQFRLATGLSPHAYVTRRRVAQAQAMLIETDMPLVEVALSVGFQTQAHFTTVFRQAVGRTPGQWRRSKRVSAAPVPMGQRRSADGATIYGSAVGAPF